MTAVDRHVALVGFMGAGKSTLGPLLAGRLGRRFRSVDERVEELAGRSVPDLFDTAGEAAFRELEERAAEEILGRREPAVVELGGGALGSERTREALGATAVTVLLAATVDECWERVAGSERPLARDRETFDRLYREREPLYRQVADATASDLDGAVLGAAGVRVEEGVLDRIADALPGDGPVALVADPTVAALYGARASASLGDRLVGTHDVPPGEEAKTPAHAERLWNELRLDRRGTLVALGGGSTLDLAGFAAATHLRGIAWAAVPTTLVGQVDAAIGGKTGVDTMRGKNLVGAFHWPARAVLDPLTLETLPEDEVANGLAEVVKTGLLVGEPLWELERAEGVRRCAAFKAAICLRDPFDRGERMQLNLGHTFAHALEAASGFRLQHGKAVALGLLAALRLSGLEEQAASVEEVLRPTPVAVDRDAAWAALTRDKKSVAGRPRIVLLEAPGRPRWNVEIGEADLRSALYSLIA